MAVVQSDLVVEVAESFEHAFDQLIKPEEWDTLLSKAQSNVVFLTRQWQQTWWNHFGTPANCQLHLLILRDEGGTLVGVAPIFVATEPLPPLKEYKRGEPSRPEGKGTPIRIVQFVGGKDIADYLDIIAEPAHMEAVWSAVLSFLLSKRDTWDAIDFHSLPDWSPSHEILARIGSEHEISFNVAPEDVCPIIELPGDWDTYLMSLRKKDRHELRRKVRKLEGRDDVRWYLVPPDDADRMQSEMQTFLDLHRSSGVDKAHFMDDKMANYFLDMARDLSDTGWLDLAVLTISNEPASAYLSYKYRGRLYLYNSGYSQRFAAYSAGVALLAYRIHKAILQGLRQFDFLRGDEEYKYDFGAKDTYIYRALYAPTK
jgi:CelD/BcsL family acetyltransferase involved in cellulose biosynthesis